LILSEETDANSAENPADEVDRHRANWIIDFDLVKKQNRQDHQHARDQANDQ
jgi:hypothetical protein